MPKRTCFIFQPIFPHFSGILAGHRAQRPISLPAVTASAISSIVFFNNTTWHFSATTPLVKLSQFYRYEDLSLSQHVFDFPSPYRFRRNVSAGLHCQCKIVTWIFLDLVATSSSLVFASFAFLRLSEPLE